MKLEELPKWAEEPFNDTKYIPIEFIEMVKKLHAQNEGYYNYIGEKELAEQESYYAMCLIDLLRAWEENRPQWAEHIPNVHSK